MNTDLKDRIKKNIKTLVYKLNGVSFVEIEKNVEGFKEENNTLWSCIPQKNIFLWCDVSDEGGTALVELLEEKSIEMRPSYIFIYLIDGICLDLPIPKRATNYKKPHWIPVVFSIPLSNKKNHGDLND